MQVKGFNGTVTFDGTFVTITRTGFRARISVGSGWGSRPALDSGGSPRASIPSCRLRRRSSPRAGVVHRMRCSTFPPAVGQLQNKLADATGYPHPTPSCETRSGCEMNGESNPTKPAKQHVTRCAQSVTDEPFLNRVLFTEKVLPKSKTVRVHFTHNRTSRTIAANAKVDPSLSRPTLCACLAPDEWVIDHSPARGGRHTGSLPLAVTSTSGQPSHLPTPTGA
jgi:hypothetical protein